MGILYQLNEWIGQSYPALKWAVSLLTMTALGIRILFKELRYSDLSKRRFVAREKIAILLFICLPIPTIILFSYCSNIYRRFTQGLIDFPAYLYQLVIYLSSFLIAISAFCYFTYWIWKTYLKQGKS